MDPDVAHPRHQSNQTVRNREEEGGGWCVVVGVVGFGGWGGGSLSPLAAGLLFFPLKVVRD